MNLFKIWILIQIWRIVLHNLIIILYSLILVLIETKTLSLIVKINKKAMQISIIKIINLNTMMIFIIIKTKI